MKKILLFTLLFGCSIISIGQSLVGKWEGQYFNDGDSIYTTRIDLQISLKKSSIKNTYTYEAITVSYYKSGDLTTKATLSVIKKDSIVIKEYESLYDGPNYGFQKFFLKLLKTNNEIILKGRWTGEDGGTGTVLFTKMIVNNRKDNTTKH